MSTLSISACAMIFSWSSLFLCSSLCSLISCIVYVTCQHKMNIMSRQLLTEIKGIFWGGFGAQAPGSLKGHQKRKKTEGERREKTYHNHGKRGAIQVRDTSFFVKIRRLSLCGRLMQKECTKSCESTSKITFLYNFWGGTSPSDTSCPHRCRFFC